MNDTRLLDAIDALTKPHDEIVHDGERYRHVKQDPLLQQIRDAMYGDLGRTSSGRSSGADRSILVLEAFTIYEDIAGRIEGWHRKITGERKRGTAEDTLRAWYAAFNAKQNEPHRVEHAIVELRRYADRIKGFFDAPRIKEIEGACPIEECGYQYSLNEEGAMSTALFAAYKEGEDPYVKCRRCEAVWTGNRTLIQLGRYLGATVNEDELRELGVALESEADQERTAN